MKQLEKARKYEELYKELFDRNSKVTTICLLLCGAFWVLKLYVLSEQCLILFFFSGGLYGVEAEFIESMFNWANIICQIS